MLYNEVMRFLYDLSRFLTNLFAIAIFLVVLAVLITIFR